MNCVYLTNEKIPLYHTENDKWKNKTNPNAEIDSAIWVRKFFDETKRSLEIFSTKQNGSRNFFFGGKSRPDNKDSGSRRDTFLLVYQNILLISNTL